MFFLLRLLNLFEITSTALQWETTGVEVTEANFKTSACLCTFYRHKYFLPLADNRTFYIFISQLVQNKQGILLLVDWKLVRESQVLGAYAGSLFEILIT